MTHIKRRRRCHRVLYVQYANPGAYPPVEHSARILADAGYDVLLLGTRHSDDVRQFSSHEHVRIRLIDFESAGWRQKVHYVWFSLWTLAWTIRWRPRWVYASDPLVCPTALMLSWLPGPKVIYHEHDSPSPEAARGEAGSPFMKLVMKARRALARRSEACVLPNAERARALGEDIGVDHVLTVWNCPARREVKSIRPAPSSDAVRVFYHGSIVPARLPEAVIAAIARLPSTVSLTFAGYETAGHPGHVNRLLERAHLLGIADRVRFLGTLPTREALLRACEASDVGLALMPMTSADINERTMAGASNKPFDYLACGLPVIVSDLPDWTQTYVVSGVGRSCDPGSPDSIAAAIGWFLDHPRERSAMSARGRQRIQEEWNYESQFMPVMTRIAAGAVRTASPLEARNHAEPRLPC